MQCIRNSVLQHVRPRESARSVLHFQSKNVLNGIGKMLCTSAGGGQDQIMTRVMTLVKKYDKIDASKVTETADFQKDLSLDSLDRVELVMAFEEEFSIEIPDEKADKLNCCADVAKYIVSETHPKASDS